MANDLVRNMRATAARFRQEAEEAQSRIAQGATASDEFTTVSVNRLGDLVEVEFAPKVIMAGPSVWATSVLSVYEKAVQDAMIERQGGQRSDSQARTVAPSETRESTPSGREPSEALQQFHATVAAMPEELTGESGAVRLVGTRWHKLIGAAAKRDLWPEEVATLTADFLAAWEQIKSQGPNLGGIDEIAR